MRFPSLASFLLPLLSVHAGAQVILNEIHYHPVERPAFDASATPVNLAGWRLEGGIDFTFPAAASIPAGGYLVVAKNPGRIEAVYSITGVLGPFTGKLGNSGDTVRLVTPTNSVSDAVSYGTNFPWAISANQLGATDDFTLLNSAPYQYKGRSLQRVSALSL